MGSGLGKTSSAHRHGWEDISERMSPYTVQRCNGLGGCGTIRRIGKVLRNLGPQPEPPPDSEWEIMFQGERDGE
jgi:hypothetical protein